MRPCTMEPLIRGGMQAHFWAPQPPVLFRTSALATSQTVSLAWEPTNSTPLPIPQMLLGKGRKARPTLPVLGDHQGKQDM